MDDKNEKFYQHLNQQFHKPDDLDHCFRYDKTTEDGGFNHNGSVRRLNANKHQEISVIRVAMLKNGDFCVDGGNANALFLHGAAKEIEDVANHQDRSDWSDD